MLGKKWTEMSQSRPNQFHLTSSTGSTGKAQRPSLLERYARDRREYRNAKEAAEIEADELADSDEELVDAEDANGGTVVIKKVPCGKQCDGCPHGPYKYVVTRDGESLNWEYKGAVEE